MSFSSLAYDDGTVAQQVRDLSGPASYIFGTPTQTCPPCFPDEPGKVLHRSGFECAARVDADSELLGLTRKASKDPVKQYRPSPSNYCHTEPLAACKPMGDCTRLCDPPCTLRDRGWERWQWLCDDPQLRAITPFQHLIQNRLVVKDNHRPCIPKPIDVTQSLPPLNNDDTVYSELDSFVCGRPSVSHVPRVGWKTAPEHDKA